MNDTPYDDVVAELVVVGCAVDNDHGSRLAHQRLTVDDFHDPALRRIFTITPDLPINAPDHSADPTLPMLHEQRTAQAAALAGLPRHEVAAVCATRTVMADDSGHYARRVKAAADARRRRARLVDAIQLLDAGDLQHHNRILHELTGATG